jgi:prolyl oligopeptidase
MTTTMTRYHTTSAYVALGLCFLLALTGVGCGLPNVPVQGTAAPAPSVEQPGTDRDPDGADPYLWLEDIEGDRALAWVQAQNEATEEALTALPVYDSLRSGFFQMFQKLDQRVPSPSVRGAYLYEFRRDSEHQRGRWLRTPPEAFLTGDAEWEVLLDVDSLAAAEGEPWVFGGSRCLPPEFLQCVVFLSRRGADAVVVREFDARRNRFVEGGFVLPEAKQGVEWRDEDALYVFSAQNPREATASGYPRVVRVWERGTALEDAPVLFEAEPSDVRVGVFSLQTHDRTAHILVHRRSFFEADLHVIRNGELVALDLPPDRDLRLMGAQMVVHTKGAWTTGGHTYAAGTVLAIDFDDYLGGSRDFTVVFEAGERTTIEQIRRTRNLLLVNVLRDVKGELHAFEHRGGAWTGRKIETPAIGSIQILGNDEYSDLFLFMHSSFLTPPTTYAHRADGHMVRLGGNPELFDTRGLAEEQFWATSKDGTRVPYFVVGPRDSVTPPGNASADRARPTVLNAYGGFGSSRSAVYIPPVGVGLLERGVVFAVANIRGGGELGPAWHRAGQRENRQAAYDDFIAVAEDMIRRGITSPERLGITGGSNSGLLVGAVLTQRPDLFGAAHASVPLFDMRRYTRLLAGSSWIGEYGDPDDPEEWAFLRRYSPYHNLSADADYPPFLITTRTHDDRVHPGHARKMAARMQAMGHDVLFNEAGSGGHGARETFHEMIADQTLIFTFLLDRIGGSHE